MFWVQGGILFVLMVAAGALMTRQLPRFRAWAGTKTRPTRVGLGVACLLGSILVLFGGLSGLVAAGGFRQESSLSPGTMVAVLIIGLIFVVVQTLGAIIFGTLVDPRFDRVGNDAPPSRVNEQRDPTA